MKKFSLNKKVIISVVLIAAIIVICFIKSILSYSFVQNCFHTLTGLKIDFEKPKTTFTAGLGINFTADKIIILNEEKNIQFVKIESPELNFKPFSLLVNKVNVKKMNAKNVLVYINRNEKGEIDFSKAFNPKYFKNFDSKKLTFVRFDSTVKNINLTFNDNYKIKNTTHLILNDNRFLLSKKDKKLLLTQKGYIDSQIDSKSNIVDININIDSKYPFKNLSKEDLKTDIHLKGENFYLLNELFKKYISKDIDTFKGSFNLVLNTLDTDFTQELNFQIKNPILVLSSKKVIAPYNIITMKGTLKPNKDAFEIESLNINSDELDINTKGKIVKPFSKKPEYEFQTEIKNTQLNRFLYFIPDNAIFYRPKGIPTLKNSNFYAKLDGKINLNYSPLNITGNLKASDVHIPNHKKPFVQNDVNAYFMKDKVRIYTRIYTPENEYVTIDGVSNLDNSLYGKYSIQSTNKIDLKYAQSYLVPVQQIIGFNIGPVPIMDISGYGNINIKTQGTLNDAQIFGEFNAYQAEAKIEGLDAKLQNGKCKLVFDNRNLIFKEIKGKIDDADFLLTGIGNTKGEVTLDTKIEDISFKNALKIFNNSIVSKPYIKLLDSITAVSGRISADIKLEGTIKDYEDKNFFNDLKLSGKFALDNNNVILKNKLKISNIKGLIAYGDIQNCALRFFINNSKVNFSASSKTLLEKIAKGDEFEFKSKISSDKFEFRDLISEIKRLNQNPQMILALINDVNFYTKFDIVSQGKISIKNINLANVKNSGYIIGLNSSQNKNIKFNSGLIKIENDKIIFNNFDTSVLDGRIKLKGGINHILSKYPMGDLNVYLNDINLDKINKYLPKIKITSSKINNGHILFKNNNLKFESFSLEYDMTPLFVNAQIKDIYKGLNKLEVDFSTIFNEAASDNIINPYLSYPIRIKGELPVKGTFRGTNNNYDIYFSATIPKESDIYFSGANLGDTTHKKEISSKFHVTKDKAFVDNFTLVKYITNQNNKTYAMPVLKANGAIIQKQNELFYNNFKISTLAPINVRILNLIFKKSLLKQGNFECNVSLNDNIKTPKMEGKFRLQDLDIPLYDTKINNIKVDISNNFIEGAILAQNKKSDIKLLFKGLNKLTPPYLINRLSVSSNNLDIQDILNSLVVSANKTDITSKQDIAIKPEDIVIENGNFEFKEVQYNKIVAQNLKGNFNYKDNIFNLNDIILDIAQGKIEGNGSYSLNTTQLKLKAIMENCSANILTREFLELSDQLFGFMDGEIDLSVKHLNTPEGIKNVKSKVSFTINDGKMPKLGSLEYLLRAGNLIKNGIIGLSLNNLIQVLTPYKTGEFEKISGDLTIEKGEVKNLQIFSQGKNLSLYLSGDYSILENFASIKIYGKLSQNISNVLGSLGNASLSQFINAIVPKKDKVKDAVLLENLAKIPPIEIENPQPRYFTVKVLGDINKDNYIKSFSWE